MLEENGVSEELDSEGQSVRLAAPLELSSEVDSGVDPGLTARLSVCILETEIVHFHYPQNLTHLCTVNESQKNIVSIQYIGSFLPTVVCGGHFGHH